MKYSILSILFLALAALSANAQDDFNPTLPGEPNALYKVTVGISHSAAGAVYGDGSYGTGKQITISRNDTGFSSSSDVYYRFKYWTLNGEEYVPAAQSSSFTYTVGTENADFKAVYEEEDPNEVSSRVYLVSEPAEACTFNRTSGQRYLEGNSVYLYYNSTSSAFTFDGWYDGDRLVTTNDYFYYEVGEDDVTLTARFSFEPTIPGEPQGGDQSNVDNTKVGDVNNDGVVDKLDINACANAILTNATNNRADINADSYVNILDLAKLIDMLLPKK